MLFMISKSNKNDNVTKNVLCDSKVTMMIWRLIACICKNALSHLIKKKPKFKM